jgi:putative DNA primase/helicase
MLPDLVTTIDQFDSDDYLIATQNGTLNLRTLEFYKSKREDYLTLQLGVDYDPEADCPRWKQFLEEVFDNDKELIEFIQKVVGYSLTGDTIEQLMFIFYGFGKNGKSVFINTIQSLLKDYAGTSSFKTFDVDKQNEQSNDVAALKGKRFVSMSESGADRKLNEPLIKQVTGGDKVSCRFLRCEFFEYVPQFKLFLATNHKPIISQSDFGIWRRIVLIPFTQNFEGREDDLLREKLQSELSGILNWAIEGLRKWQSEGLKPFPKSVQEATAEYRKDSDSIGQWFESEMSEHPESKIKSSEAHQNYSEWCKENGCYAVGSRVFKASLEERGFRLKKESKGNYWIGFGLPFELNS